jgi:hypothetical protein
VLVGCLVSLAIVAGVIFLLKAPGHPLIDYPADGTVFPPDIAAPAFRWSGADADVVAWHVEVSFDDGGPALQATAGAPPWTPTQSQWQAIKSRSVAGAATVTIAGLRGDGSKARRGSVSIRTAKEPVGAPLFYREVPLPFSEAVKDPSRIRWRFGSVSSPTQPPVVLDKLPDCGRDSRRRGWPAGCSVEGCATPADHPPCELVSNPYKLPPPPVPPPHKSL